MTMLLGENDATPVQLEVYKSGQYFIGDLVWSDGAKWYGWQQFKRLRDLKRNARLTFDGSIVRV